MSRTRDIARIMGKTEAGNPSNASLLSGTASMTVYSTLDSLPINGLTSGDQAFVNATNRLYISNGTGWYNVALVNRNPRWDSGGEPEAAYSIADSVTPLTITARAADSDNLNLLNQSAATDSAQHMVTISNDSSVWTFTPKSADSIGAAVLAGDLTDSNGDFIYTFKWSDGVNFVSKAVTITYNPAGGGGGYNPTSDGWWNRINFSGLSTVRSSSAYELPRGIVGASDGSIYVVGDEAANDIGMLVKLNADGNVQWAKQLNANAYYARPYSVNVSADGNSIYTIGQDYGWGENNGGGVTPQVGFIIKWTSAGVVSWVKIIKPQTVSNNYDSFDPQFACQIDSQGNVWTLGTNRTGNTERKVVIAKINGSTGALINMWRLGSAATSQASHYNMFIDEDDNVYTCTVQYVGSYPHMVIAKFNSSMSMQWLKQYGETNNSSIGPYDVAYNIKLDSNKDVYLTGYTDTSSTPYTGFLMKLSGTDGSIVWAKKHNDTSWHHGLAIDGADNIWIMGEDADATPAKFILRKYSTDGTLVDQWGIDNNVTNYNIGDGVNNLSLTKDGNLLAHFYYAYGADYQFAPMKLPANPTAGTYTNIVISDQTNSEATYSPSTQTSVSYSVSDITSSWHTTNYNSGSYALEPIATLSTTEDLDTI